MASSLLHKAAKRIEPRKSHSWWWDSHASVKNSKWLADNLEEMDRHIKSTLKLIEDDGDTFTFKKKAEMYYKQRPELKSHVEESYRMYRSLAERYDHLIGELKRNMPPDISSHGTVGSDLGSEPNSPFATPESRLIRHRSGPRAAGFDVFLGSGGSGSESYGKADETSSISVSDSEAESDVSSINNYCGMPGNHGEEELQGKITAEMYTEVGDAKEKSMLQHQENGNGSLRRVGSESIDDLLSKLSGYEEELKLAREKVRLSDDEISNLKIELESLRSLDEAYGQQQELLETEDGIESESVEEVSNPSDKMRRLSEELRITKGKVFALEKELVHLRTENKSSSENIRELQDQLKVAQKNAAAWKSKLDTEKRHASKMQERIARYKASLTDRDSEVRELKETISDSNKKYQLHAEISRLSDEKTCLEQKLREWELRCHNLETQLLSLEKKLSDETEQLKAAMTEKTQEFKILKEELDALKLKYDSLMTERDELNAKVIRLDAEVGSGDEQLRIEVGDLRKEVERQKVLTKEAAEGKREAIKHLCISIEHYRNGYYQLRQAYTGLKQQHSVFAS